jgi:hypothetical protein
MFVLECNGKDAYHCTNSCKSGCMSSDKLRCTGLDNAKEHSDGGKITNDDPSGFDSVALTKYCADVLHGNCRCIPNSN